MPKLFCPSMALCENRVIQPVGPIDLETMDGGFVSIPEPSAHTGVRPVPIKLLSFSHRIGLVSNIYFELKCIQLKIDISSVPLPKYKLQNIKIIYRANLVLFLNVCLFRLIWLSIVTVEDTLLHLQNLMKYALQIAFIR